jgi:hypothetical protein
MVSSTKVVAVAVAVVVARRQRQLRRWRRWRQWQRWTTIGGENGRHRERRLSHDSMR